MSIEVMRAWWLFWVIFWFIVACVWSWNTNAFWTGLSFGMCVFALHSLSKTFKNGGKQKENNAPR